MRINYRDRDVEASVKRKYFLLYQLFTYIFRIFHSTSFI